MHRQRRQSASSGFAFGLKYDATAPTITAADSGDAANANGWFNRPVAFTIRGTDATSGLAGCPGTTYSGPDSANASVTGVCSDRAGNSSSRAFPLQYDATPPDVGDGQPARAADAAGWYNHPVAVVFSGTDQLSGIDTCSTPPYSGPDSAMAAVVGTCIDKAGNAGAMRPRSLKYDETPPIVTAVRTDRPPDHGAWFNAPVRLALEATDATSGVAECPPVTYGGPDSASVSLTGTCRDVAGNAAGRTFPLSFDATPPRLTKLSASGGDRRLTLRWRATGGAAAVEILRSPGLDGAPTSVVFRGAGDGFVDSKVVNGNRYAYEVRVLDAAGNGVSRTVRAVPGPRLIAPADGAVVKGRKPPVLRWTPIRGADYYNVQLFREGRKILSAWPTRARLALKRAWRYRGRRVRLEAGEYKWLVWPGQGTRSKADYGERIGVRKFTVR